MNQNLEYETSAHNTARDTVLVNVLDVNAVKRENPAKSNYIYEAPVRIWHWVNVLAIVVLCVTGYFIGSPLPSQPGEAFDHFSMGYIRFAHFSAAYIFTVGLLGRIYWAFVGNLHARELFSLRANPEGSRNVAAKYSKFFLFFISSIVLICTGFAMYGEGTQAGSWANILFSSWVIPLLGQSQDVHTWHHLTMWIVIFFIIIHVYAAIYDDISGRENSVSTMISGFRTYKD